MSLDLLFVAKNRYRFTQEALRTLFLNTDWNLVSQAVVYDDGSEDGTDRLLIGFDEVRTTCFGSAVAVMNNFVIRSQAEFVAKIDNDTILPPGWLNICMDVLSQHPELDLLGLECKNPLGVEPYSYTASDHVGGIFVARRKIFCEHPLPEVDGVYYGFTDWQRDNNVSRGWLNPGIPVFLIDRLPHEPWTSLSTQYEERDWQRWWKHYDESEHALWDWWEHGRQVNLNPEQPPKGSQLRLR